MTFYPPIQFTGPGSPIWTGRPYKSSIQSILYYVTAPDSQGRQYMRLDSGGNLTRLKTQADYDRLNFHLKQRGVIR